jgi:hypothetical protein
LKGDRKNVDIGICPKCRKEEELNNRLRCDGTKMLREDILVRDFGISIQK